MNAKKIFIIAALLLALTAGSLAVYNIFFANNSSPSETATSNNGALSNNGNQSGNVLPSSNPSGTASSNSSQNPVSASNLKIKPISKEKVSGASIGEDGQSVKYFSRTNGHVISSDFNGGNIKEISSVTLNGLIKAIWSPDKGKVIGVFTDNDTTKKYFYDYSDNQSALLNANIGYVAWSPDSRQIAYEFTSAGTDQSTISISNPDGSNWKDIFKTRLDNLIVEWPIKEKISLRTPVSGVSQGLLYTIDSVTGDFAKILSDLYGLNVLWSPKADKILYSKTTSYGKEPSLMLSDETGNATKDLKLSGLVDKCVWSLDDRTVFCGLPQDMSPDATWPDDYYKGLVTLKDDFYKINLETGEKTKILGSTDQFSYDAQNLFLSPKEDYLFFTNRADGLLYSLKLQ